MATPAMIAGDWNTGPAVAYLEKGFILDDLPAEVDKILHHDSSEEEQCFHFLNLRQRSRIVRFRSGNHTRPPTVEDKDLFVKSFP